MAHRLSYLVAQGQGGVRSGISLGIPFSMANPAAANGLIPFASLPIEVPVWIAPALVTADAFVTTLLDVNPAANEPAPTFALQSVRVALNAAFAAAANSFNVLLRRFTSAGVLVGTLATLFNGVTDTSVAQAMIEKKVFTNNPINVSDVVTAQLTGNGAGAAVPAFGGILDIQG